MPLFEVSDSGLQRQAVATFKELGMYERVDLQPLLRDDISTLDDDLFVVAEEYGNWEDARRRIDLLAIDRTGHLVVIELKRTDDGGHMELQALRYAAMVSSLDFSDVVEAYTRHCGQLRPDDEVDARAELVEFLDQPGDDEPAISTDVRIVLVSADFGREITTTVLWLNRFDGMDICCIRLVPYEVEGKVLLDIQQVLPLPEATDYQVRLRRKDAARERARSSGRDYTRFHIVVDGTALPAENKRHAMRVMVEQLVAQGAPPHEIATTLPPRKLRVIHGSVTDGDAVRDALAANYPGIDVHRYFCDSPLVDDETGETYVLNNQWGRNTEETLATLAGAFGQQKVSFEREDHYGDKNLAR